MCGVSLIVMALEREPRVSPVREGGGGGVGVSLVV